MWNKIKIILQIINTNLDKLRYIVYVLLNIGTTLASLWSVVLLGNIVEYKLKNNRQQESV